MKKSWLLFIFFIFFIWTVFAADQIENTETTTTSTTISTVENTDTTSVYTITPIVTQSADGKDIIVTLELKDDFKWDITGWAIYMKYNKDFLIYKSVNKWTLIGEKDILDSSNSKDGIGVFEFTSDDNKDRSGELLSIIFTKNNNVKEGDSLSFEIVETLGTDKSELLVDGSSVKISGKTDYIVTTNTIPESITPSTTLEDTTLIDTTKSTKIENITTSTTDKTNNTKTNITADITKTKTGAEDYLLLSLTLLLISGVLVVKNKKAI